MSWLRRGFSLLNLWPLPALLAWALAWGLFLGLHDLGLLQSLALALPAGALPALLQTRRWRRLMVAGGFPLSLLVSGWAQGLPAWAWLLPLALLALLYPRHAWQDAPLYPTPRGALRELAAFAPLAPGAWVLDAGCGLGHGLAELHRAYPVAVLEGIEWSALLARLAGWRCRFARVRRGDMWAADWSRYAMLYLFQRPESMARAWAKARAEMVPGTWLVSLDFEVEGVVAEICLELGGRHRLWVYRL